MELGTLAGLFVAAFLAATLLPASSELVLGGLVAAEAAPVALLLAAATAGNVLGSLTNWAIGRGLVSLGSTHRLAPDPAHLARAESWYRRWGRWSLLLSWAPVIGDLLTLAAGTLREPLASFLPLVTAAKLGRYLVVAWVAASAM